jgi:hypothetical protein
MEELILAACKAKVCPPKGKGRPIVQQGVAFVWIKKGAVKDVSGNPIAYGHALFNGDNFLTRSRVLALQGDAFILPWGSISWGLSATTTKFFDKSFGGNLKPPVQFKESTLTITPNASYGLDADYVRWFCEMVDKITGYDLYAITSSGHVRVLDNVQIGAEIMTPEFNESNDIWVGSNLSIMLRLMGSCPVAFSEFDERQLQEIKEYPSFTVVNTGVGGGVSLVVDNCDCLSLHTTNVGGTATFDTEEAVNCLFWNTAICEGSTALPTGVKFNPVVVTAGTAPDSTLGVLTIPDGLTVGDTYKFFVTVQKGCYSGILCVNLTVV